MISRMLPVLRGIRRWPLSVVLQGLLCTTLVLYTSTARGDVLDPTAVLAAYEHTVRQYWDHVEITCSASLPDATHSGTLFLTEKRVCLVTEIDHQDSQKPDTKVYTIGTVERLLKIRGVDVKGGNPEDWYIGSTLEPPDDALLQPAGAFWASAFVGIFAATTEDEITTIPTLLREAVTLTATRKTVDDMEVIALNARHPDCTIEVLVIPSKEYVLYRLEYRVSDPKPGRPRRSATQFRDYFQSDGLWLPRVGTRTLDIVSRTANSASIADESSDKVSKIEFHLEPLHKRSDTEISDLIDGILGKIQNGTRVRMDDAPHLEYEWQDGKAVP